MYEIKFPYVEAHKRYHPESSMALIRFRNPNVEKILSLDVNEMQMLLSSHIDHADFQIVPYYKKWLHNQNSCSISKLDSTLYTYINY